MVYRTMQGKEIDLDKIMLQNETMPAIGNMRVNARGDELGPGGQIIKRKDDIMAEYYEAAPTVQDPSPAIVEEVPVVAKAPVVAKSTKLEE